MMNNLTPAGRNDGHTSDYTKVTDNIFIGSNLCKGDVCPIHGPEFEKLNICVEINLDDTRKEIPPSRIEGYFWMPVVDGYPPSPVQFEMGVAIMKSSVDAGKNVYVHCKNGHGRSPTLVAAYLIKYLNMTPAEANNFIKEKRPEIHIEDSQMKALEEFADK